MDYCVKRLSLRIFVILLAFGLTISESNCFTDIVVRAAQDGGEHSAKLEAIEFDGHSVFDFEMDKVEYTVQLPYRYVENQPDYFAVPTVVATPLDSDAKVNITYPEKVDGGTILINVSNGGVSEEYKLHIQTVGKNMLTNSGFENDDGWQRYTLNSFGFEYSTEKALAGNRAGYMAGPRKDAAYSYRQYVDATVGKTYIVSAAAMHRINKFGIYHSFACNDKNIAFNKKYWNEFGDEIAGTKAPYRIFTTNYEFNRGFATFDCYTKDGTGIPSTKVSHQIETWDYDSCFWIDEHFFGELVIADVDITCDRKTVCVPRNGQNDTTLKLNARFTNQFGNSAGLTEERITSWNVLGNPLGVSVSSDGVVSVSADANPGTVTIEGVVEPSFLSLVQDKTAGRYTLDIKPTPNAERTYLFSDDFEAEELGSAPSRWVSCLGDADALKVENETGNKFARITVRNNIQNVVRTKENAISFCNNENKKYIIEGKIRSGNNTFDKNLCLNYPLDNPYASPENHHALLQIGKGVTARFGLANYNISDGQPKLKVIYDREADCGRWYELRIILDPSSKRAAYYIDSCLSAPDGNYGYLSSKELELTAVDSIAFVCKDVGEDGGHLDFDDIKIYSVENVQQPDSAKIEGKSVAFIPNNGFRKQAYLVSLYSQAEPFVTKYNEYDVNWSIVGNDLGAQIDNMGNLTVPAEARQGKVMIRVSARPLLNEDIGILLSNTFEVTLAGCSAEINYMKDTERLIDLRTGNISAEIKVENGVVPQKFFVMHALYEQNGNSSIIKQVAADEVGFLNAGETKYYNSNTLFVSDIDQQIVKTFVWNENAMPLLEAQLLKKGNQKCELYVSPNGDNSADGSLATPFATVVKARNEIRKMKMNGGLPKGGVTVFLRGGEYHEPFIPLEAEDTGTKDCPIVYRAYENEKPVFVGGRTIPQSAMRPISNEAVKNRIIDETAREHIIEVNLAALGIEKIYDLNYVGAFGASKKYPADTPQELSADGEPMHLARYPNESYMTINSAVSPGSDATDGKGLIIGCDNSRMKYWKNAEDLRLFGYFYYNWADESVKVKQINEETGTIEAYTAASHGVRKGQHFYAYNAIEELDFPGEYYIDRANKMLYFYPPTGSEKNNFYLSEQNWTGFWLYQLSNITLEGIRLTAYRGNGINIMESDYCTVKNCEIDNTGDYAVVINGLKNQMVNCDIHDVSGGVWVNKGSTALIPFNNIVCNNRFKRCDRLNKTYSPAVLLGGVGNVICHNEISEADHQGIYFDGNDNIIEYNEIFDVCKSTDDAGAIYTGGQYWTQRGNQVRYNYIHDLYSDKDAECGIYGVYLDGQACGSTIFGNVFENIDFGDPAAGCWGASVHVGGGKDNKILNNVLVNCGEPKFSTTGVYPPNTKVFVERMQSVPYREEPWKTKYPELYSLLERDDYYKPTGNAECNNVYYGTDVVIRYERPEIVNLVEYKNNLSYKKGENPGFLNLAGRNYGFSEDSEVYIKNPNFKPIPFTEMGRR